MSIRRADEEHEWSSAQLCQSLMLARLSGGSSVMWHTTDPAEKGDRRWHSAFFSMLTGPDSRQTMCWQLKSGNEVLIPLSMKCRQKQQENERAGCNRSELISANTCDRAGMEIDIGSDADILEPPMTLRAAASISGLTALAP